MDLWIRRSSLLHYLDSSQCIPPVGDRYAVGDVCQEVRFLHRSVTAAYCHNVFSFEEESITGRATGDSLSSKLGLRWQSKPLGVRAGGDDYALPLVRLPTSHYLERPR